MSTLAVAEAAVIGMPNAKLGEKVGAAVALKPGAYRSRPGSCAPSSRSSPSSVLTRGASAQVAAYKYPRRVWFTEALPKGPTWKTLNREIVEPGRGGRAVTTTMTPEQASGPAGSLYAMLIDAALGPVRRFAPDISTARLLAALARWPRTPARRLRSLAAESERIARTTSTLATAPPHHPRTKWGRYAGRDYRAGAGPDGESDLACAAVPEHADPETVMARMGALA